MGWNNTGLTINDTPLYIRGCGKHEDADVSYSLYLAVLLSIYCYG